MSHPKNALFLLGLLLIASPSFAAPIKNSDLKTLEKIPVQSGGRIKPFSSFAREAVIFVTGKETLDGKDSVKLLLEWLARPKIWEAQPLIPILPGALRDSLGLSREHRVSPEFLLSNPAFLERAEQSQTKTDAGETLTALEQKELELYQKMNLFYSSAQGKTWTILPSDAMDLQKRWLSLDDIMSEEKFHPLQSSFHALLENYRGGNAEGFRQVSEEFLKALTKSLPPEPKAFVLEIHYNRLRPFRWAWYFYLLGLLVLLLSRPLTKNGHPLLARWGMTSVLGGFLLHTYGFILRCLIAGRPPVSNMYESIVWVSWAVVFFSVILFAFYRFPYLIIASAAVTTFGLILADSLPAALDPSISPLVPVLRNNFWLTIHVLTITLSYGAFALALGIGHLALVTYAFWAERENLLKNLTQLLYHAIQIGVILLASGTILGGVWANDSWGRFWGWDPKETWALIALLGYLALLHCRFTGWIGPFGLAVGSVVGFLGILMAWYGVNFVLASGLHSYGFGGGGLPYVTVFVLVDLAGIALLAALYRRKRRLSEGPVSAGENSRYSEK